MGTEKEERPCLAIGAPVVALADHRYNFTDHAIFPPQNLVPRFGGNTLKSVSRAFQLGITLQLVENKSVENLAEREGFEPSVQVLARTTV